MFSCAITITCFSEAAAKSSVVTYIRQHRDKVMKEGFLCCLSDFLHAHVAHIVSILNVLSDAAVKQHRLLGHNADLGPQEGHVDFG